MIHTHRGDSGIQSVAAPSVRVAATKGSDVLGFISIFAASIAGYADVGLWAITACAIALASTSYAENYALYRRGRELGLSDATRATALRSFVNALLASGGAYASGYLLRSFGI
jgi:hypothetical protein